MPRAGERARRAVGGEHRAAGDAGGGADQRSGGHLLDEPLSGPGRVVAEHIGKQRRGPVSVAQHAPAHRFADNDAAHQPGAESAEVGRDLKAEKVETDQQVMSLASSGLLVARWQRRQVPAQPVAEFGRERVWLEVHGASA